MYEASVEVFIGEMHLGPYFLFTQMKATLRAGRKEVEVGGESSEDREAISLQRCLGKLGVLRWHIEKFVR